MDLTINLQKSTGGMIMQTFSFNKFANLNLIVKTIAEELGCSAVMFLVVPCMHLPRGTLAKGHHCGFLANHNVK